MKQRTLLWLAGMAGVAVIVAAQVVSAQHSGSEFVESGSGGAAG